MQKVLLLSACVLLLVLFRQADLPTPVSTEITAEPSSRYIVLRSTARVRTARCDAGGQTGSGVLVGSRLILTNKHVISRARLAEVSSWRGQVARVISVYRAPGKDIALLRLDRDFDEEPLRFAKALPGQETVVSGYPSGGRVRIEPGELLAYLESGDLPRRLSKQSPAMLLSQGVEKGSSGGPVFDYDGRVVGLIFAGIFSGKNKSSRSLAIPGEEIRRATLKTDFRELGCAALNQKQDLQKERASE